MVIVGLFPATFAPFDPMKQDLGQALSGPTSEHWLGTDTLGRDLLSQLIFGIRPSLVGAVQALAAFLAIGVSVGILVGYVGGRLDSIVGRTVDLVMAIPAIIMILVVLGVFPNNPPAAMIALGALASLGLIRIVRGSTLSVREEPFVTAARVSGVKPTRIMRTHIFRRVLGPILVQASLFVGIALVLQAALSYLGLLSGGERITWGGMIGNAATVISRSSWSLVPPGVTIGLTVLAFGLLGDALRDVSAGQTDKPRRRRIRAIPIEAMGATPPSAGRSIAPVVAEPASESQALLEVRSLTIGLDDEQHTSLVTDVSFTVNSGETVVVVGESGCGKSLTALAIIGLLPPGVHVVDGTVAFRGRDLAAGNGQGYAAFAVGRSATCRSTRSPASIQPTPSAATSTKSFAATRTCRDRRPRTRAIELLGQVKFADPERVMASYPHQLSGGMAQRARDRVGDRRSSRTDRGRRTHHCARRHVAVRDPRPAPRAPRHHRIGDHVDHARLGSRG